MLEVSEPERRGPFEIRATDAETGETFPIYRWQLVANVRVEGGRGEGDLRSMIALTGDLREDWRRYLESPEYREAVERARAEDRAIRIGRLLLPVVRAWRWLRGRPV